jgi:acyl carrier protein
VDSSGRKRELLIGISAGVDEAGDLRPALNVYARTSDFYLGGSSSTWTLIGSGYTGAVQSNGQTSGTFTLGLTFLSSTRSATLNLDVRGLSFSSGHSPYSTIVNAVRQAVSDKSGLSLDDLPESTNFVKSLGWDSLDMVELATLIEEALNIDIPDSPDPGVDLSTIGAVAKYIFDLQDPQYAATAGTQTSVAFTSIDSTSQAQAALTVVQARLSELSTQRGELGAVQSRLQSSSNLLSVKRETSTAAESRIRDVDVAAETANLVSRQIKQQTASAVLRQASVQPQLALRLLENI